MFSFRVLQFERKVMMPPQCAPLSRVLMLVCLLVAGTAVAVISVASAAAAPAAPAVLAAPGVIAAKGADANDATDDVVAAKAAADASAEAALRALSVRVTRESDPGALSTAFRAYFRYRSARPDLVRKPYLYYIDLGLDNRTPRGYVFDMERLELVEGPFTVAHGRGSLAPRDGVPTRFSNVPGSYMSSLGLYLAEETYTFRGGSYTSIGLRLRGESGEFNSAARRRGIVAHGAPYVSARDAGRSEGCPAMEEARARRLLPRLAEGGVVFIFSPNDERWLATDPWASAD
jgi:hypothetical protein